MANKPPLPPLITRVEAWQQHLRHYFTGKPCKRGHLSQRYVVSGACVDCLLGTFRYRRHPYDKQMIPYMCPKFWVRDGMTPEHHELLETYLQQCIDEFTRVNLPPRVTCPHGYNIEMIANGKQVCDKGCTPYRAAPTQI